jgi:hypothetical protein
MAPWLGLELHAGGWTLTDTGYAQQILGVVADSSTQSLSIQVFVGKALKAQALRVLHPCNNVGRYSKTGLAPIHLAHSESRPGILIETSTSPEPLSRSPPSKPLHLYPIQDSHDRS